MTGVIVWKELREQAMSLVALLLLGAGLMICRDIFAGPGVEHDQTDEMIAVVMAWVCGLIAGVQPIANERESGTFGWLDSLPAPRRRIWIAKAVSAAVGVAAQSAGLLLAVAALGHTASLIRDPEVILALVVSAANGLAFGLFGSAVARTPLGAIGWALLSQFASALAVIIVATPNRASRSWETIVWALYALLSLLPALVSYRLFTRPDRSRRRMASRIGAVHGQWRAMFWLVWRQSRWFHTVMLAAGLAIASILPGSEPIAWPFFGTVLGAMLGVSVFAVDNLGGECRFFGDRRIPLGPVWLVKAGLALVTLAIIILIVPLNIALVFADSGYRGNVAFAWQEMGFSPVAAPAMIFLGPMYGFAIGQFFGLICRKGAVAGVLTLLSTTGLVVVWLPSIIVGGLAVWQWLIPPLVLIVATRYLMRPWVAGRLGTWRPATGIVLAGVLSLGSMAFGIWWREISIPDVGPPFDADAYVASAVKPENNQSGAKLRLAADQLESRLQLISPVPQSPNAILPGTSADLYEHAVASTMTSWPLDDARLNDWMDTLVAGEWLRTVRQAVASPPGDVGSSWPAVAGDRINYRLGQVCGLLGARGLQLQARGNQDEGLAMYRLALDVTRHWRPRSSVSQYDSVTQAEMNLMRKLPPWAAKAADQPDLLRAYLTMLRDGEAALPPLTDTIKSAYVTAGQPLFPSDPRRSQFWRNLQESSYFVPWEQDRTRRILDLAFAGWIRTAELDYRTALERTEKCGSPVPRHPIFQGWMPTKSGDAGRIERDNVWRLVTANLYTSVNTCPDFLFSRQPETIAHWRAARLQIALVLYEREHKKPAEKLADLVPDILPELPLDPFNGEQFHYRISRGELIKTHETGPDDAALFSEVGRGIVWSVSTNLVDDGGLLDGGYWRGFGRGEAGRDLIFVVPKAAK